MALFGPEFQGTRQILALIACFSIMYVARGTAGQALIGAGKMWIVLFMTLGWALLFLPLVVLWSSSMGAVGLAQAYVVSYYCVSLAFLVYIRVKFGPVGVQHCHILVFLTCLLFVLALLRERLPEIVLIPLSLACACLTAIWGWRLLPNQAKEKLLELTHYKQFFAKGTRAC